MICAGPTVVAFAEIGGGALIVVDAVVVASFAVDAFAVALAMDSMITLTWESIMEPTDWVAVGMIGLGAKGEAVRQ